MIRIRSNAERIDRKGDTILLKCGKGRLRRRFEFARMRKGEIASDDSNSLECGRERSIDDLNTLKCAKKGSGGRF